ncbi:MAG: hypothetical protein ACRCX8_14280 [Sarcina sp.]
MKLQNLKDVSIGLVVVFGTLVLYTTVSNMHKNTTQEEINVRGVIYTKDCPKCLADDSMECYMDLNIGQESDEANCIECKYSYRKEYN